MSGEPIQGNDTDIDVMRLLSAVWRRRYPVVALLALVCVMAATVSSSVTPRYRAESRVLIEAREPAVPQATQREVERAQYIDEQGIASQVEIINSTNLIRSVIDRLDLSGNPEFNEAGRQSPLARALDGFGLAGEPVEGESGEQLIDAFRDHLSVYRVSNSRVIVIRFWSRDRALAARAANVVAAAYLNLQSGAKLSSDTDATAWLKPQIADLREKVRLAEAKVAEYRAQTGLLLVDDSATLVTRQLTEISSELSRVRAAKAEAQARATAVRNAIDGSRSTENFANAVQSEAVQQLRERQAALRARVAELSVTLLDGHPRLRGLRSQLRDVDGRIRAEARNILRRFESEAEIAELREKELAAQLETLKADSARAGSESVELRALEREATAQRELLETYLGRYREAASRSDRGNLPADARVISEAVPPAKPYFPKVLPITAIAGVAALLIGAIAIMLAELFSGRALRPVGQDRWTGVDSSRSSPVDVEAGEPEAVTFFGEAPATVDELAEPGGLPAMDLPAMDLPADETSGSVPPVADGENGNMSLDMEGDLDAEPDPVAGVNGARGDEMPPVDRGALIADRENSHDVSAVASHLVAAGAPLAVVVSPEGDEGSAGSVALARMLAGARRQTLLIDMTGSACATRAMVAETDLPGITDVLADACDLSQALHADRLSGAHILPQGTMDPAKAMMQAESLPVIVGMVAQFYHVVVVECGPADAAGVKRLLGDEKAELIVSVVDPDEESITVCLTDFYSGGFDRLLLMNPRAGVPDGAHDVPFGDTDPYSPGTGAPPWQD